jgi:hypothetical protein
MTGKLNKHFSSLFKFIKTFRFHVLILIGFIAYLLLAPFVYNDLFIKFGKPVDYTDKFPAPTNNISLSIDSFDSTTYEGHITKSLEGWALLYDEPDQSKYERFVVLQSEARTYFFTVEPVKRSLLQESFSNLGLDILYSGFRAFISEEHIKPGTYQVGILFKNKFDGTAYYTISPSVIQRTANKILIYSTESQETAAEENVYDGTEIHFDQTMLEPTDKLTVYMDTLSSELINEIPAIRVMGWAFLQDVEDQALYERFVVLLSDQTTLYFPVDSMERQDVQDEFASLGLDLHLSGFTTLISTAILKEENYEIGVVFQHKTQKTVVFSRTNWIISQQSGQYMLVRK